MEYRAVRIATLAQLAWMPVGTIVSPLVMEDGSMVFDVQGIVQMCPKARVTRVTETFLEITDELPEVRVCNGRILTRPSVTDYILPGNYAHRFVVWDVCDKDWQPMATAPLNQPILAWCDDNAGQTTTEELKQGRLNTYEAHAEGLSRASNGPHVVEFGGAWDDRSYEEPNAGHLPDWWFVAGSDFEIVAYPVCWKPLGARPGHYLA